MAKKEFEYEFNPIKDQKGNEQAQSVVWSTKSIEAAVDAIKKGLPLKVNPFIGNNTKLLKPELVFKRTEEEIADYVRCMQDVTYFAEKCFVMTPEGLKPIRLRDYQYTYLQHLQNNRFSIFLACRQAGKSVVTAIYCLWKILFNIDKAGLILSKSAAAGVDLLGKIKDMFLNLPYYLKPGIYKWNQHEIAFDNNSNIGTEAFSPTAGLGKTINFLILDEFAWCPNNEVELFYMNIIPTITTMPDSNVCIMSTQNGFNFFYTLWRGANEVGNDWNGYKPYKVDWNQVPNYNMETHQWEKRTEAWKQKMIGVLAGEANFYYQYGTQFSASDKCIINRVKLSELHDNEVKFLNIPHLQEYYKNEYGTEFDLGITLLHPEHLYFNPHYNFNNLQNEFIILLCDLAEGGGNDFTTFNIIKMHEKDKFEQIGYWHANTVNLELAAVEFWLICSQLFNSDKCAYSIEWNTYGQLFFNYLMNLNETDYKMEYSWRFNLSQELDLSHVIRYTMKFEVDEGGTKIKKTKRIPGIRFNASNKVTACSLLKLLIENGYLQIYDYFTISEIENFEDKNGNGSYAASYGHDDIVMTLAQIPMLQQTAKYKELCEELVEMKNIQNSDGIYNAFEAMGMYSF
jgi:hypothetical protein